MSQLSWYGGCTLVDILRQVSNRESEYKQREAENKDSHSTHMGIVATLEVLASQFSLGDTPYPPLHQGCSACIFSETTHPEGRSIAGGTWQIASSAGLAMAL